MPNYDDYLDFHYGDEYAPGRCDEIDDLYDDYDDYEEDDSQEWDNYYHTIADEISDDWFFSVDATWWDK